MFITRFISGITVVLFRHTMGRLAASMRRTLPATRPMHGTHYRLSQAPRYGGHSSCPALEVLCPDGRWRRFEWISNHTSPLCEDGRRQLQARRPHRSGELAAQIFYMSDKFIGPTHMGPESAPDESSLRDTVHIGLYALDPNCREANSQLGHPWHGRDYCEVLADPSIDSSWANRAGDIKLLPCYDTVAGMRAGLKRPSLAILLVTLTAVAMPLIVSFIMCFR